MDVADLIQDWLACQLPPTGASKAWQVGRSKFGGRGLFATRDIQPNEVIFVDVPIILGPRRSGGPLCGLPGGCRLPVCSDQCAKSPRHLPECRLLASADNNQAQVSADGGWSMQLFHALAALRSLTLDDQQRAIVKRTAETLRQVLGPRLSHPQEEWIVQSCRAMDTNAFETVQVPHQDMGHGNGLLGHENGSLGHENEPESHVNGSVGHKNGLGHENGSLDRENGLEIHVNGHKNGLSSGTNGLVHENGSDNESLGHVNGSVGNENGSMSQENGSDGLVGHENGGLGPKNGSSHRNGSLSQENGSVSLKNGSPTHETGSDDENESQCDKIGSQRSRGSLRGLYPLGALMNHSCWPNTTHSYDTQCHMQMMAATLIKQGDELSTSYVSQLWDTASRRHMLAKTKQFACRCDRCKDPEEFGSMLSGLPCPECTDGLLLCSRPLDPRTPDWRCMSCEQLIATARVQEIQRGQGRLLAAIDTSDPDHVITFLGEGRVPDGGLVAVQLKAGLNTFLGHVQGYKLHELSDEHLKVKEKICRDLLSVMDKLKIGNTRLKGLNVFDLHLTLGEKMRRIKLEEDNEDDANDSLKLEMMKTWELAKKILSNDATAPTDFHKKLRSSTNID
ncbi:SET domain-containing protein SmydA-8 [Nilaparvata lugens]|uniref:SET domain-containing protein SmydA-8 n=1 Tax=Nilaparvata lugens TaxID=108931 RepID=UPI00193DF2FE|nr:SET domain-containing protein SmydA-8 [Nilaparvata lugens]